LPKHTPFLFVGAGVLDNSCNAELIALLRCFCPHCSTCQDVYSWYRNCLICKPVASVCIK